MMDQPKRELTVEELYTIVGELEIVRRKSFKQIETLQKQVDEKTAELSRLREKVGE